MASDRVIFNVGGTRFETTTQTVNSLPDNYFAKLIEDRWCDVSGTEIFIDRDPTHFRHFLNYLRSRIVPKCLNSKEWNELKVEAEYYDILNVLPLDREDIEAVEAENLVPGDLVCLTPTAVDDVGELLGRIPDPVLKCNGFCKPDEVYDAFGFYGFCVSCGTNLHGAWSCVEDAMDSRVQCLRDQLAMRHSKYIAEKTKFTISKVLSAECVLLSPVPHEHSLPIPTLYECHNIQPHPQLFVHILRKYLRKVGHK